MPSAEPGLNFLRVGSCPRIVQVFKGFNVVMHAAPRCELFEISALDEIRAFGSERRWSGPPIVATVLVDQLGPKLLDVGCKGGWLLEHSQAPFKLEVDLDWGFGSGCGRTHASGPSRLRLSSRPV